MSVIRGDAMMLRVTTPFGLETVVQRLADASASNSVHPSPRSEEMTSAMYAPMNLEPGWHNDPVGELRIHGWLPSSSGH